MDESVASWWTTCLTCIRSWVQSPALKKKVLITRVSTLFTFVLPHLILLFVQYVVQTDRQTHTHTRHLGCYLFHTNVIIVHVLISDLLFSLKSVLWRFFKISSHYGLQCEVPCEWFIAFLMSFSNTNNIQWTAWHVNLWAHFQVFLKNTWKYYWVIEYA
jgi:hypothetical protein